jgi:hypothetical protein
LEEHKNLQNSLKIWKRSQTREIRAFEKFNVLGCWGIGKIVKLTFKVGT